MSTIHYLSPIHFKRNCYLSVCDPENFMHLCSRVNRYSHGKYINIFNYTTMKISNNLKNSLFKATFYSALFLTLGGLASCDSDLDNKYYSDAEPIFLELTAKIETDNSFALDLFKTTYQFSDAPNVFVSPLSVNMALSMTLNGAAGETLEEMKEALRAKSYSLDNINTYNKSLREALLKVDPTTTLSIANSIWYRNTFTAKQSFISVNKNYYNAEVKALDFNAPNAVKQINDWVSDKTRKKIPAIIDEISAETMVYLINAIYFKGVWKSKFNKSNTVDENFYSEDRVSMSKVKMMKQRASFLYTEDENCRYLKMPYGNGAFSMIVLLPQDDRTVDDVITNLDNKSWNNAMRMDSYEVNLHLPRFSTECKYEMENSILPAMGMEIPFSDYADFSGMADGILLKISKVIHKTFVDVNEDGAEAAAVTAVGIDNMMAAPPPGTVIDYVVNKPFAFAICENSTGIILFIGKIVDVR